MRRTAPLRLPFPLAAAFSLALLAALLLTCATAQAQPAREAYAKLGSARIRYLDQGQGPDAVVFIHGWSCDASFWDAQMAAVGRERRVLALDLIGFGKSDAPQAEYSLGLLAKSLGAVLDTAGVRRAVLVGHSLGFSVARRYLADNPGRVAGLFIVDGAYMDLPGDEPRARGVLRLLDAPEAQSAAGWRAFVTGFVTPMLLESTPPEAKVKIISTMTAARRHVAESALRSFLRGEAFGPAPAGLPARAVYAAALPGKEGRREYLSRAFPGLAYEEWTDTGHFIMFDQAERLNGAVALFSAQALR